MEKSRHAKIIFYCVVLAVGLCYSWARSQPVQSEQRITSDVGRDNPFAEIPQKEKFIQPEALRPSQRLDVESPELFVETVTLKLLDAKNLMTAIAGMSSGYGSVSVDEKSNSLIVCDTKENLEKILAQIRKAEHAPEQVMVEVVILDVQLGDDTEIGVDWDRLFSPERDETYTQTLIPTTFTTGGVFTVTKRDIISTVRALQEIRNVEILASPRILVASGQEAFIQTVEEIPYIELSESSGGTGGTYITSTEFKEAGVSLKVKVIVTDDRKIMMTIEPEQSINSGEAGVGDTTVPIVDKRKAKTTLFMEDGQVICMGGLRKKEIRITRDQIPLLGDLPLVGFLFAYDKKEVKNTELLVLISPHIYKGEPISDEEMTKYKELVERPILSLPYDWRDWFRNIGKQPKGK